MAYEVLPDHGTRRRYNARDPLVRCRCDRCRRANTDYMTRYRATQRIAAGRFAQLELPGTS
jgi:hypothetical protein